MFVCVMQGKLAGLIIAAVVVVAGVAGAVIVLNGQSSKASESMRDITSIGLEVYGNADWDYDVDEDDADLIQSYVNGDQAYKDELIANGFHTALADANKDGRINGDDVAQVRAIAAGTADRIWLKDGLGNDRSVSTEIDRIGAEYYANVELCLILGLADKMVAVDNAPYVYRDFYFTAEQQSHIVNLVNMNEPDYDMVNGQNLDILLTFFTGAYDAKQDKLIGTDVLYLGLYNPDMSNAEGSNFFQGILKAGYIFNKVDRAEGYARWVLDTRDRLAAIADGIPEDEKPTVLMSNYMSSYFINADIKTASAYCFIDPLGQACLLGGGRNVAQQLVGNDTYASSRYQSLQVDALFNDDESVHIDYIFLHMVKYT